MMNMDKKFSEMDRAELDAEMQRLMGESRKKEQAGFISEANVLEQKFYLAKSYALDPSQIIVGDTYEIIGESSLFTVDYLNGVFAWGKLAEDDELRAFPIARLK